MQNVIWSDKITKSIIQISNYIENNLYYINDSSAFSLTATFSVHMHIVSVRTVAIIDNRGKISHYALLLILAVCKPLFKIFEFNIFVLMGIHF